MPRRAESPAQTVPATVAEVPPVLLDVPGVARALTLSAVHVRRLLKAGTLPYLRVGRAIRVRYSDVRRFAGEAS